MNEDGPSASLGVLSDLSMRPTDRASAAQRLLLPGLGLLLAVLVLVSAGNGAVSIAPAQVVAILADRLGLSLPVAWEPQQAAVLLAIRLPRLVLAGIVGASLGMAGAVMQGIFRNPLAEPGLVGVSSGAGLAAAVVIVLGLPAQGLGAAALPLFAFLGAALATWVVVGLGRQDGRTQVATMLLAGIAINAIAGAGTGLLVAVSDDAQLRSLTFWMLGSLGGATWPMLAVVAPLTLTPALVALALARPLDVLSLGERAAGSLGIEVERLKQLSVLLVALSVGASVAVTGVIAFVGLVVPHLVRLAVGPGHRLVLPGSLLLGACLLVLADLVSRTVVAPAELPVGVVTTLVGGPFFLGLLLRHRRGGLA